MASVLFSLEMLQKIKTSLEVLSPKEKREYTTKEAIAFLKETIDDMKTKNYTDSEIVTELEKHGIMVKTSTLQVYLREKGKGGSKKERTTKRHSLKAKKTPAIENKDFATLKKEEEGIDVNEPNPKKVTIENAETRLPERNTKFSITADTENL